MLSAGDTWARLGKYRKNPGTAAAYCSKHEAQPAAVQLVGIIGVVEFPEVGGLHHRYERAAA